MAKIVMMKHEATGIVEKGFYGFSWTSFFFGGFPALFRGDFALGIALIVVSLVLCVMGVGFLNLVISLIWAFVYNRTYTLKLLEKGYQFCDTFSVVEEAKKNLKIAPNANR